MKWEVLAVLLLIVGSLILIVSTYKGNAQAFDEPCHVAAAIELVDRGSYTLDPVHPPLSRWVLGLPLYLQGARFPSWPAGDLRASNYNEVGNEILNHDGRYRRWLGLARLTVLPFFIILAVLVHLWTHQLFGKVAALVATALFTTTPTILAFSGLAYTDIAAACTQFGALWAVANWLDKADRKASLILGLALGLAFATKFTALLFLPAAAVAMFGCRLLANRKQKAVASVRIRWMQQVALIVTVTVVVVWAGYGFAFQGVQEGMHMSPKTMPSFQYFPAGLRGVSRALIEKDVRIPAPALLRGVALVWVLNQEAPPAYLLGKIKSGGWWYFFLVGLAVKFPIPLMALCLVGLFSLLGEAQAGRWIALAPIAGALAIVLVTMPVKYNAGVRHVLVLFPLGALLGGAGGTYLWHKSGRGRVFGRLVLGILLLWQVGISLRAHPDYIAYFNQFAGGDPSKVLVAGCDLDCGQDLFRLADVLHERHISQPGIAVWSSADTSQIGLPPFEVLQPFEPRAGWVAVSFRALRFGSVFHQGYPAGGLDWVERYEPVQRVGKTTLLYYIPEKRSEQLNGPTTRKR